MPGDTYKQYTTQIWVHRTEIIVTPMKKIHFQHFLRVPNRKTQYRIKNITDLGYTEIKTSATNVVAAKQWCKENLKEGSYVNASSHFVFAYKDDAILFGLCWGG